MSTLQLSISGMSCAHCVKTVESTLRGLTGVEMANVDLKKKQATVTYRQGEIAPEQIATAVSDVGYEATVAP